MAKKKLGRPSSYSEKVASEICTRIASGQSLLQICRDEHLPERMTVHRWLLDNKHISFCYNYTRARELQADYLFDEILDIADDGSNDWMEVETKAGRMIEVHNHEIVNRSRLRIETRKWYLSKVLPKKYGDKIDANESDDRLNDEVEFVGVPTKEGNGRFKRFYN